MLIAVKIPRALFGLTKEILRHLLRRPVVGVVALARTPDGRFLLLKDSGRGRSQDRVVLVQNWTEDVKRLVPSN